MLSTEFVLSEFPFPLRKILDPQLAFAMLKMTSYYRLCDVKSAFLIYLYRLKLEMYVHVGQLLWTW